MACPSASQRTRKVLRLSCPSLVSVKAHVQLAEEHARTQGTGKACASFSPQGNPSYSPPTTATSGSFANRWYVQDVILLSAFSIVLALYLEEARTPPRRPDLTRSDDVTNLGFVIQGRVFPPSFDIFGPCINISCQNRW